MKRLLGAGCALLSAVLLMGAADGSWLHRVSPSDHARVNPLPVAGRESDASAGAQLFHNECAKCHGDNGLGKGSRPPVVSDRIAHTSDGDLFWLMTNGNPWKGMPPWISLPARERWQLVTYLRALNPDETTPAADTAPAPQTGSGSGR